MSLCKEDVRIFTYPPPSYLYDRNRGTQTKKFLSRCLVAEGKNSNEALHHDTPPSIGTCKSNGNWSRRPTGELFFIGLREPEIEINSLHLHYRLDGPLHKQAWRHHHQYASRKHLNPAAHPERQTNTDIIATIAATHPPPPRIVRHWHCPHLAGHLDTRGLSVP